MLAFSQLPLAGKLATSVRSSLISSQFCRGSYICTAISSAPQIAFCIGTLSTNTRCNLKFMTRFPSILNNLRQLQQTTNGIVGQQTRVRIVFSCSRNRKPQVQWSNMSLQGPPSGTEHTPALEGSRDSGRTLKIRPVEKTDLDILQEWDRKPHIVAISGEDEISWEEEISRSEQPWMDILIAELEDERPHAIGVIVIIDTAEEETHYWGFEDVAQKKAIDIWIGEEQYLGQGYGTQMMRHALNMCFSDKSVRSVMIDPLESNKRAQRFYSKCGFVVVGPRRFGNDDCLVMEISRKRWEVVHQEAHRA